MDNSPRRSKRLGKGLSALIPEINEEVDKKDIIQIKLKKILLKSMLKYLTPLLKVMKR